MKFETYAHKIVIYQHIKFHEDLSFRCRDIRKTILVFLIIDFQCNFDISAIMHLRSLQRWIITEWLWNFFKTRSQNGPISVKWKHQSQLIFCISRLSHKHITFGTLKLTPCTLYMKRGIPAGFAKQILQPLLSRLPLSYLFVCYVSNDMFMFMYINNCGINARKQINHCIEKFN